MPHSYGFSLAPAEVESGRMYLKMISVTAGKAAASAAKIKIGMYCRGIAQPDTPSYHTGQPPASAAPIRHCPAILLNVELNVIGANRRLWALSSELRLNTHGGNAKQ